MPSSLLPGHSVNRIGLPPSLLASTAFNDHPLSLHVDGVRQTNAALFEMLSQAVDGDEAAQAFITYMTALFGAEPEQRPPPGEPPPRRGWARPYRFSFLRLLIGWGYDSCGPEGAVLKGWVESQFGLVPTFHKEVMDDPSGPAWAAYETEKMGSPFHANAIFGQLDLLYEYCQWTLASQVAPDGDHLTLYRGVNDFDGHQIIARPARGQAVVRLNNLGSFTDDPEVADCFGATVLKVRVPVVKILFFNRLLPFYPLKGEGEYLVIGGDYLVATNRA